MPGGRDIAPILNELLSLPFKLKIATRDFHPPDHISFATAHHPPNNIAFESTVDIVNPQDNTQQYTIPLWPPHCVQGTQGVEIIPQLHVSKIDIILNKGRDKRLETFSGFADVFGLQDSEAIDLNLARALRTKGITHVFTVGLAGDYCVKCTALDACKEGFEVFVVQEAVKSIQSGESGWGEARRQMEEKGIHIVAFDGPEVDMVRRLG